jgi:uncharacterized protein
MRLFPITLLFSITLHAQEIRIDAIPFPMQWENNPLAFSRKANDLTITAGPKTDMFRDPNVTYNTDNAPKLLFTPDADFVLTARIEHPHTSKWDGGAIVIKQDSLNWVKFCFEKDYTAAHRVVTVVTKDVSDDCNSGEIKGNAVFYKIAKADNVITLYVSNDGAKWFLVRHLQMNLKPGFKAGFLAQSPSGDKATVKFSHINYRHVRIKDPYEGE